jgi:hypothetical protein
MCPSVLFSVAISVATTYLRKSIILEKVMNNSSSISRPSSRSINQHFSNSFRCIFSSLVTVNSLNIRVRMSKSLPQSNQLTFF